MEPLLQKSQHPARPGTHLSWMWPQHHTHDGGGGAFMQTQNLPFIMIISTIILICSFYLYFPQGLAVLFVFLYCFSWAGLSVRAGVAGAGSHKDFRHVLPGMPSLCGTMLSVNSPKHTKSIPYLPLEDLSWLFRPCGAHWAGEEVEPSFLTAQFSEAVRTISSYFLLRFGIVGINVFFPLCSQKRNKALNWSAHLLICMG